MNQATENKMILAVLQEEDYEETVSELNKNGFFVTQLSSTGGFLKKRNYTVMIGVEQAKVDQVLEILKAQAGRRMQASYQYYAAIPHGGAAMPVPSVPVQRETGGVTVFIMDLNAIEKF